LIWRDQASDWTPKCTFLWFNPIWMGLYALLMGWGCHPTSCWFFKWWVQMTHVKNKKK
jgi:hypothetical protein